MSKDSYLDRIKKVTQTAQNRLAEDLPKARQLLDHSVAATSALATKAASSVADGYASSVEKARQVFGVEEVSRDGDGGEGGLGTQKTVAGVGKSAQMLVGLPTASPVPEMADSEESTIRRAIDKMRGRDKLGLAGEHLAGVGSAAAGVAAAGTIAGAAGATTLLGSTSLAGLLGGIFVTATPVGWVIGSAAVFGAAGYGIAKLIRAGSEQDQVRKGFIERQAQRLMALEAERATQDEKIELGQLMALTVAAGVMEEDSARRMVDLVNGGQLPASLALQRVRALAMAKSLIEVPG